MADTYDRPRIQERTDIREALIGTIISGNIDNEVSAAFRAI